MFTGIITDMGKVVALTPAGVGDTCLRIATQFPLTHLGLGDSIACNGICLTVTNRGEDTARWFEVEASAETLACTTLGAWKVGQGVNLERALAMGDVLGGHLVSGHVDGVATLVSSAPEQGSVRWELEAPEALAPFLAEKGSVTLEGVSLTVNAVHSNRFGVNLIAHTLAHTTLGTMQAGQALNIEIDLIARYVARMLEGRA